MAVLKTTSPAPSAFAPKDFPATTVPSSRASRASLMDHLAAHEGHVRPAAQLPALKRRIFRFRFSFRGVVFPIRLDVENRDIGRGAARERPACKAEDLRAGGEFLD